jgi:hypothetical protein
MRSFKQGKAVKLTRISGEKILPILVNRTVISIFLMCLLTIFLYTAGTIQGFIDSTQLSLLNLYSVLGILLIISSVCGAALGFDRFHKTKKARYLLRSSGYIIMLIFGIVTVFAVTAINAISIGI